VTLCHLEDSKVLDNSLYVSVYNFLTFYTVNVLFSTPPHHISSLLFKETKTVLADATSHNLFDLGLGVKNF